MNFAGTFLGLLLLGAGVAGSLLTLKVRALADGAVDPELGFAPTGPGSVATYTPPEPGTTYLAISTEPTTPGRRALSLGGILILVLAVAAVSAFTIWNIGSMIVEAIFSQISD